MNIKKLLATILVFFIPLVLAACSDLNRNDQPNIGTFIIEIEAADQKITDGAVVIDKASIPVDGWLAIHEIEEKKIGEGPLETRLEPAKLLGFKFLPRGKNEGILIEIKPTSQKRLMAIIYVDKGQKGILDDAETDHPYYHNAGSLLTIFNLAD